MFFIYFKAFVDLLAGPIRQWEKGDNARSFYCFLEGGRFDEFVELSRRQVIKLSRLL